MDFGELKNDEIFIAKVDSVNTLLNKVEENIKIAQTLNDADLGTEDKVKKDLLLCYSMNSLYWIYLKLQGIEPTTHDIKNELSRVRQAMIRDKQIYEWKTARPVVDKEASKRFVRHGLWDPKNKQEQNKKKKFEDSND